MSRSVSTQDILSAARSFVSGNPPPGLSVLGLCGSSAADSAGASSDIDLFAFAPRLSDIFLTVWVPAFISHLNVYTGLWAEVITGTTPNRGTFAVNPFTLDTIRSSHVLIHGTSSQFGDITRNMYASYRGMSPSRYLLGSLSGANIKLKKTLIMVGDHQPLASVPAFGLSAVSVPDPLSHKATTLAKHLLATCGFAVSLSGYITGNDSLRPYNKRQAPDRLGAILGRGVCLDPAFTARDIYYHGARQPGLYDSFIQQDILPWIATIDTHITTLDAMLPPEHTMV